MNRDVPNTENRFRNVPLKYQKFCGEKLVENIAYAAALTKSGRYGVLFKEFIASITSKSSSHYSLVQYISDPDSRHPNENINAGFLFRIETHVISLNLICSFVEEDRIRCQMKELTFSELKSMSNIISAFSVQDVNDKWYIVIDTKEGTNSSAYH
jgi:hypothetical protein